MTRKIAERSRRAPSDGKRNHKIAVGFSDSEWARIEAAAERAGLVNAAYIGMAALAATDPEVAAGHATRAELRALADATEQVRRVSCLLEQVIMTMRALQQVRPAIERIAVRVWDRVEALDDAALAVARPLRARRRHR